MEQEQATASSISTLYKRPRLLIAAIMIVILLLLMIRIFFHDAYEKAPELLQPGWQFYSSPTTLEPVGTVFRIDPLGRKYIVSDMEVPSATGREEMGRVSLKLITRGDVIARFLKVPLSGKVEGMRNQSIELEMVNAERAITSDLNIDKVLNSFFEKIQYRTDNRYFIIREARSASELHYKLNDSFVADLGGSAVVNQLATMNADMQFESNRRYNLSQSFSERMRVMFLPEEIVPVSAPLGSGMPEVDVVPVKEVLVWVD
ncbi:MAG: hypothetical protein KZQ93_05755 [Candidatus Thiodiazotropha sp. (ex Monitilora ramsayi)]|nr:hypothetical protein [Candidatus Thiodiazotropha sp. (ex Monitilora ramsayi)]